MNEDFEHAHRQDGFSAKQTGRGRSPSGPTVLNVAARAARSESNTSAVKPSTAGTG